MKTSLRLLAEASQKALKSAAQFKISSESETLDDLKGKPKKAEFARLRADLPIYNITLHSKVRVIR